MYRVNLKGQFNVPIGSKDKVILDTDNFERTAKALENAEIVNSDFESIIDRAVDGDLVYIDPPYTVKHNNNGFVKYAYSAPYYTTIPLQSTPVIPLQNTPLWCKFSAA